MFEVQGSRQMSESIRSSVLQDALRSRVRRAKSHVSGQVEMVSVIRVEVIDRFKSQLNTNS